MRCTCVVTHFLLVKFIKLQCKIEFKKIKHTLFLSHFSHFSKGKNLHHKIESKRKL